MPSSRVLAALVPLAALVFALAFVGVEHFNGGVKTHHLLARSELPGFSNWLSVLILPLLGSVVAVRAYSMHSVPSGRVLSSSLVAGAAGSLVYGAALAASFHWGLEQVSAALFAGLFLVSLALPVYRAECIFGFVTGMTITFGSVIPLAFAIAFAALSFAVRRAAAHVVNAWRKRRP